jgi:hypothetical protein
VKREEEDRAWAALPPGDCAALRRFVNDWPDGAHRPAATARLDAVSVTRPEHWEARDKRVSLYLSENRAAATTEARAREQALATGQRDAEQRCRTLPSSDYRFLNATASAEAGDWTCRREPSGWFCSAQGTALCRLEERVVTEVERCGGPS